MGLENMVEGTSYLNNPSIQHGMPGVYVVFEGPFRSGKTTQSKKVKAYLEKKFPDREIIWTREPGALDENENVQSYIAEAIRNVVQGTEFKEQMEPECEASLYAASRAQTLRQVVSPALKRGAIVISDRSYLSSCAFQGGGKGLGIEKIYEINKNAIGKIVPDYIIYIDISYEEALQRQSDAEGDKHEKEGPEFVKAVRDTYIKLSKRPELKDKWITIDGSGTIEEVFSKVKKAVTDFLQSS